MTILLIFAALVASHMLGVYCMFIALKRHYPVTYMVLVEEVKQHREKEDE